MRSKFINVLKFRVHVSRRSWVPAIVLGWVLSAGGVVMAWPDGGGQAASEPKATRPIPCTGPCQVKPLDEAVLAFERPGILGAIEVREGDLVQAGQFLAKLQDDVAKATLAVAEETADSDIDIRYAAAAADVAVDEVARMEKANERSARTIPEFDVLRARLNKTKTELEVEKAKHTRALNVLKRDEAAAQLATYRVEAPFDGFVSRVHLTKGASVKQGDAVIKLVSTRKMKVEGDVTLRDAALIRPGAKVSVQLMLPDASGGEAAKSYPGKLVFVDVEVKVLTPGSPVRVWAEVDNVDGMLRAGLTATMTILPSKGE